MLSALPALLAAIAPPRPIGGWRQAERLDARPSTANCTWKLFNQTLDHFGAAGGTFPQRYCVYDKWWRSATQGGFHAASDAPGPILFYTGNESPVEEYINNTGLMWELAEGMGALVVFAEHRYEPLSHPALCGHAPRLCFAYCTTAQALADWGALLAHLRARHAVRAPAVAFGGSYGGMLAGWLRIKYPEVVDGAIAASAPIWQLAQTVVKETLDLPSVAITRGVSAVGGATDMCRDNLRAAWPLLREVGRAKGGLRLLGESMRTCRTPSGEEDVLQWGQYPFFLLAEGNYPFPSTYITFSVGPGLEPLPAWPMRAACASLNRDFGIHLDGSAREVNYTLRLGALQVRVDWGEASGNGPTLTEAEIRASGVLALATAVADAAGVWYNVTKDKPCYEVASSREAASRSEAVSRSQTVGIDPTPTEGVRTASNEGCAACPPCEGCPPCPVAYCNWEEAAPCSYTRSLSKTFSWEGICCNDALSQVDAQGVGRDIFWPPSVPHRNYTVESIVGPHELRPGGCAATYDAQGLRGAPMVSDPWSGWMTAYYGGRNISSHRNIIWSNGALDPWSGQGVYPPGGSADGPMVQNISQDGSQIALVLDLGAHHLDLMFSDPRNPPCFTEARKIEKRMIRQWIQEAYDTNKA